MQDNYDDRVVLFLDILDFKGIIDMTVNPDGTDNREAIKKLYEALKIVKDTLLIGVPNDNSKRIIQFSDSIVISFDASDKGQMFNLLTDIHFLTKLLVMNDILCRGGIAYGKLYHDNNFVFGPAFNNAYHTESKAALYPRIILDKSVLTITSQYCDNELNSPLYELMSIYTVINGDTDEMRYIDYIEKAEFGNEIIGVSKQQYSEKLKAIILKGLTSPAPDIKVKYGWMQNKYNKLVEKWKERYLRTDGIDMGEPDMIDFVRQMERIV